jgi:predicted ATPase/class 3 adenylate cyclase
VLPLPSGTVTFVFTDIVGSTRRWEEEPDAMRVELERHDALLRSAIESNGGHVVKGTGDGTLAAFSDADAALRAAAQAQGAVAGTVPFGVRVAVHTGAADQRDGDYFGPTLNRAARLVAVAHGGQVLVSQATASLVSGANLRDLGEHRMRDLSRPERVYQLVIDDLPADFPPLRSLEAYAGNLALQVTSFVGREDESKALARALDHARLVTIVGVGGVGKTRLATHVAADLLARYPHGAWVCELAVARESEAVADVVAGALDVTVQPGTTAEQSVVEFLRAKSALLVLDNCEHVLDAAGAMADAILRSCAEVRIIATSREPLAIDGEHITALRSLPIAGDAVRLFEDRARAVRTDFQVDESNAPAVDEICRRLDGIPLAIELAAARVVAMSPAEIASLLDERFRLLTGGRRGSVERHQTLRATVEWSYSSLSTDEQAVFDRLAVFAGFDATAARSVAADGVLDAWSVLDAIEALVRKSMLTPEEQLDGNMRFQLLETLRQYALEQLIARAELDAWRRHAVYFADFAEDIAPLLLGPDELKWRPRLYADLDNVRNAAIWALESDDRDDNEYGVRILAALAEEFAMDTRVRWALPSAERALDAARRSTPGRLAAVLASAAWEAQSRFDTESHIAYGREALGDGLPDDCPSPYRVCFALAGMGGHNVGASGLPEIAAIYAQFEAIAPPAELARICSILVQGNVMKQDFGEARRWADRGDALARESRNPSTVAQVSYHLGTLWARDEPARAIEAYEASIAFGGGGANDATFGAALFQCALLRARAGDHAAALSHLHHAIEVQNWMSQKPQLEGALAYAIEIFTTVGAYEPAAVLAGAARSGALTHVRRMTVPPERQQRSADPIREALGDSFDELAARGAAMSFDELVAWTLATISGMTGLAVRGE